PATASWSSRKAAATSPPASASPSSRSTCCEMTALTVELIDRARSSVPTIVADARRRLPHLAYADLRIEVTEARYAAADRGAERASGAACACPAGVRVLAGDRAVAPGWIGIVLGAADVADLEQRLIEAIERAYRRAMANAEHKATAREKFGPLG